MGADRVTIRDLSEEDLADLGWSGDAKHIEAVAKELERSKSGEVDYLVACGPSGLPIAKGCIDYAPDATAGTIMQLAVHPALQSQGLGTLLIKAAEQRIWERGLTRARMAVEVNNPRARRLYERLGYVAQGEEPMCWDTSQGRYETVCTIMIKEIVFR